MTSFKRSLYSQHCRPPHYRTPSPPILSEIELLSPVSLHDDLVDSVRPRNGFFIQGAERRSALGQKRTWEESQQGYNGDIMAGFRQADSDGHRRHKSLGSLPGTSAMDAFATIALAMSESAQSSMHRLVGLSDRPLKQVKLESREAYSITQPALVPAGIHPPPSQAVKMRPYEPAMNISTEQNPIITPALPVTSTDDAELLLNVSRAIVLSPTTRRLSATQPTSLKLNGEGNTNKAESEPQPVVFGGSPTLAMDQSNWSATVSEEKNAEQNSCLHQLETAPTMDQSNSSATSSEEKHVEQNSWDQMDQSISSAMVSEGKHAEQHSWHSQLETARAMDQSNLAATMSEERNAEQHSCHDPLEAMDQSNSLGTVSERPHAEQRSAPAMAPITAPATDQSASSATVSEERNAEQHSYPDQLEAMEQSNLLPTVSEEEHAEQRSAPAMDQSTSSDTVSEERHVEQRPAPTMDNSNLPATVSEEKHAEQRPCHQQLEAPPVMDQSNSSNMVSEEKHIEQRSCHQQLETAPAMDYSNSLAMVSEENQAEQRPCHQQLETSLVMDHSNLLATVSEEVHAEKFSAPAIDQSTSSDTVSEEKHAEQRPAPAVDQTNSSFTVSEERHVEKLPAPTMDNSNMSATFSEENQAEQRPCHQQSDAPSVMDQTSSSNTVLEEKHTEQRSCHQQLETADGSDKLMGSVYHSDDSSYKQPSTETSMHASSGDQRHSEGEPCPSSGNFEEVLEVNKTSGLSSREGDHMVAEEKSQLDTQNIPSQNESERTMSVAQEQTNLEVGRLSENQAGSFSDQPEEKSSPAYNHNLDSLDLMNTNTSACSNARSDHSSLSMVGEPPVLETSLIRPHSSHLISGHDSGSASISHEKCTKDDTQISRASNSFSKPRRGSAPEVFRRELARARNHSPEFERRVEKKLVTDHSAITGPLESIINPPVHPQSEMVSQAKGQKATCKGCRTLPNGTGVSPEDEEASWIRCDGCKQWFHFACAGLTAKEVRSVDKFSCRDCWDRHGPTTYVRKSARTHTAIDYARLNEGVVKTSDESPNHPYIKLIKERTYQFSLDNFPRVAPELITAEFFEKGNGMKEPVVIPASMNPQRKSFFESEDPSIVGSSSTDDLEPLPSSQDEDDIDTCMTDGYEYDHTPDYGQDKLDMVIPQGLTVRQVAEIYGPSEKVDVIDVKSQESAPWNLKKWADYYEGENKKQIKNVISLEISSSKLGRLIKRPKVVRELDLADSVWPPELKAKGDFPKVQLYCLMSVADSFTDFHIDFGGSSVFYHILKGKKTFLFIPPKSKHLKKYEQWCQSPVQQQTFLADQTKECYRVDLSAGDTMLIPSGWIHAVWTPEDSLVIGGNFLTRLNYGMQLQIAEIEKNTKVARKFRYPHFQKVLWLTAIKYLKDDPLPSMVEKSLQEGGKFVRSVPPYDEFDEWGPSSRPGPENYQARYYSRFELDGLPDLVRYLFRTALIAMGKIMDGITADTRQRVARAIPKGHGEPLEIVKRFAIWSAWKRGNEHIPAWAYPNAKIMDDIAKTGEKKLSAAAMKRLEREAAKEARRVNPPRQSQRKKRKVSIDGGGGIGAGQVTSTTTLDTINHIPPSTEDHDGGGNVVIKDQEPKSPTTTTAAAVVIKSKSIKTPSSSSAAAALEIKSSSSTTTKSRKRTASTANLEDYHQHQQPSNGKNKNNNNNAKRDSTTTTNNNNTTATSTTTTTTTKEKDMRAIITDTFAGESKETMKLVREMAFGLRRR